MPESSNRAFSFVLLQTRREHILARSRMGPDGSIAEGSLSYHRRLSGIRSALRGQQASNNMANNQYSDSQAESGSPLRQQERLTAASNSEPPNNHNPLNLRPAPAGLFVITLKVESRHASYTTTD